MARVYADSARLGLEETLADTPDDPQRRILRGLALAYMGRKAEAIREGERGLALLPPSGDGYTGPYLEHQLARIYILAGEQEKALDRLEPLLRTPYFLSPGWLRIDPAFDPLRKHPRFSEAGGGHCLSDAPAAYLSKRCHHGTSIMPDPVAALRERLTGRYVFERELGRGGMATVYLARDLKHAPPGRAQGACTPNLAVTLGPERFRREIRLVARLQHPHIVNRARLRRQPRAASGSPCPSSRARACATGSGGRSSCRWRMRSRIAREAADALHYAHGQGVIHRDIKPENILLSAGHALVADFGIALALRGGETLTEPGVAVGTPAYMSPEQAAGEPELDARTDVYSLGTVLFEMLGGEPPFTGSTMQAMATRRLTGEIPNLRRLRPSVTEAMDQTIRKALAPVPADRFASAGELARALAPAALDVGRPGAGARRHSGTGR